jgi:hypothetical protein
MPRGWLRAPGAAPAAAEHLVGRVALSSAVDGSVICLILGPKVWLLYARVADALSSEYDSAVTTHNEGQPADPKEPFAKVRFWDAIMSVSCSLAGPILFMQAINLADKLSTFSEHWQLRVVGQFNGHDLMAPARLTASSTWWNPRAWAPLPTSRWGARHSRRSVSRDRC